MEQLAHRDSDHICDAAQRPDACIRPTTLDLAEKAFADPGVRRDIPEGSAPRPPHLAKPPPYLSVVAGGRRFDGSRCSTIPALWELNSHRSSTRSVRKNASSAARTSQCGPTEMSIAVAKTG